MTRHALRTTMLSAAVALILTGCFAHQAEVPAPPADVIVPPRPSPNRSDLPQLGHREAAPETSQSSPAAGFFDILTNFKTAYARAGRPRMLIFVNEVLERDFQSYRSGTRMVWQDRVKGSRSDPEGPSRMSMSRSSSVRQEVAIRRGRRLMPPEWGVARAQELFFDPFLQSGAHLVDVNVAIRSFASDNSARLSGTSRPNIEFTAWKKYADVMIELLFIPNFRTKTWRVAAKAVDIRTGQSLSYVTSYDENAGGEAAQIPGAPPTPAQRDNALKRVLRVTFKLMDQLSRTWTASAPGSRTVFRRSTGRTSSLPGTSSSLPREPVPRAHRPSGSPEDVMFERYVDKYLKNYRRRSGA